MYNPREPTANINKNNTNPTFFVGNKENMAAISLDCSASRFYGSIFRASPIPKGIGPKIGQNEKIISGPTRKYLHQSFLIFFAFSINI